MIHRHLIKSSYGGLPRRRRAEEVSLPVWLIEHTTKVGGGKVSQKA